jgi:hypothetical protein
VTNEGNQTEVNDKKISKYQKEMGVTSTDQYLPKMIQAGTPEVA